MKKLLNTLLAVTASMALAHGASAKDDAQSIINSKGCAGCHGSDGNSSAPSFPKLAGQGERYLLKQMIDVRDGTRNIAEMTGMLKGLSDEQLQSVAAFFAKKTTQLAGAKEAKVMLNNGAKVDSLTMGQRVFNAGNIETGVPACSGCHSPKGLGNSPAGYPRLSGQHAAYISKQLKLFRSGERANDGEAMTMRMVAEQMSDAEIDAISNYISGLH